MKFRVVGFVFRKNGDVRSQLIRGDAVTFGRDSHRKWTACSMCLIEWISMNVDMIVLRGDSGGDAADLRG